MTPQPDSTPILIMAFATILFVALLLFIAFVLKETGKATNEFDPYDEGFVNGDDDVIFDDSEPEKYIGPFSAEISSFNEFDIEFMKDTLSPRWSRHPVWVKAFNLYNRNNKPVSILCSPCYFKVLQYIIHLKRKEDEKNKIDQEKGGQHGC